MGRCCLVDRQSRLSELNSDVIDEERSGIVCRTMNASESPIVSGIKEERKNQPARKEEQAGDLRNRVIGVLRDRKDTMSNSISLNVLTRKPLYSLRTCTLAIYSTSDDN